MSLSESVRRIGVEPKHFAEAVAEKNLKTAGLWQANAGRSLSLGDFALVNAARTELGSITPDMAFYLSMIESIIAVQDEVAALSPNPEQLLFACSGPDDEVAYVWAMVPPKPSVERPPPGKLGVAPHVKR
jgi:hypothetical protein